MNVHTNAKAMLGILWYLKKYKLLTIYIFCHYLEVKQRLWILGM